MKLQYFGMYFIRYVNRIDSYYLSMKVGGMIVLKIDIMVDQEEVLDVEIRYRISVDLN